MKSNIVIPFKIFPSIGFKNSSFQVYAFENNITLELFKENKKINTFYPKTNNPIIITELKEPGDYIAKCFINGEIFSQTLKVEDLLRWGSSTFKKAFVFDDIDYSFYLMKDRMFIYDEIEKVTFLENKLSPSEICKIDNNHLLFITHKGIGVNQRSNFAIFSLENFSIISELVDDFIEISFNKENNFLWVLEPKTNCIKGFDFNHNASLTPIISIDNSISFTKSETKKIIIIKQLESIVFIDCNTNIPYSYPLNDNSLIDNNGYLLEKQDAQYYLSNPIQGKNKEKIDLNINLNIANKLNHFFHVGNHFKYDNEEFDFNERVEKVVNTHNENLPEGKSYHTFYLNNSEDKISIENSEHEIIFMRNKILIYEILSIKKLLHIKYKISNGAILKNAIFTVINKYNLIDSTNSSDNIIKDNFCLGIELLNEDFVLVKYHNNNEIYCNGNTLESIEKNRKTQTISLPEQSKSFIIINSDSEFQVYSSKDILNNIIQGKKIHNAPYILKHKTIWYSNSGNDRLTGYSLLNEKMILFNGNHHSIYNFNEHYFTSSIKQIYNPSTGELKNTIVGNLVAFSNSFEKIISRRNEDLCLTIKNQLNNLVSTHEIKIEEDLYKESYLSPDSKFMIFRRKDNSYVIYDTLKETEQVFICDNFIRFNSNNQIEVADSEPRNIKIIDPETFETISYGQSDLYEFQSPDGKLFAASRMKTQYFNLLNNTEINNIEYYNLEKRISENNIDFFNNNKESLTKIGIENNIALWSNKDKIISCKKFIKIGIIGTDVKIDIEIPNNTWFYNYSTFSYDNKYLSIVGNTTSSSSNGMILIIKLDFDNPKNIIIEEDRFLSYLPKNATWICAFSRKGAFATYDSKPDTYIINCNDNLFNKASKLYSIKDYDLRNMLINFYKIENVSLVKGKNFLTFSPSGNYIALSDQGYDPLSLGGYGHQESESVHIYNLEKEEIIDTFNFHGEVVDINNMKKLKFVSFSEDETKMLSLGTDGVIYFRNLNLN